MSNLDNNNKQIKSKEEIFYQDTPKELIEYYKKINKKRICVFCYKHEVPNNAMADICKECWEKFIRSSYNEILKKDPNENQDNKRREKKEFFL
ncbi:MAG: hypothetical protein ACTSWR_03720 [Candidatus Helarchaeota archaeon]